MPQCSVITCKQESVGKVTHGRFTFEMCMKHKDQPAHKIGMSFPKPRVRSADG